MKAWHNSHKSEDAIYMKKWRETNKLQRISYAKRTYNKMRKERLIYAKKYREVHKNEISLYNKLHRKESREKYRNSYFTDVKFRLAVVLRSRLRMAIKNNQKVGSAVRDLGCTISELKYYLEGKFQDGMTWENYGNWHIDHIIPLAFYDLTNREQLLQACHYTNLQPLWAEENLNKIHQDIELIRQYENR